MKWSKRLLFGCIPYWYAGHNEHTTRFTFNIDKTTEEYPYRLSIFGNYLGDFKTLKSAKDFAEIELQAAISNLGHK
jgi:hypothetical protein